MNPHELAEKVQRIGSLYARAQEELADLDEKEMRAWPTLRNEHKTNAEAERAWKATEDGIKQMRLGRQLRAWEKEMSGDKAMLRVLENEARNQY